jgi:acyl-CoA thioesterase-1
MPAAHGHHGLWIATLVAFALLGAGPARAADSHEPPRDDGHHDARFLYTALGDSTGVGVGAREGGYVAHLFAQLTTVRPHAQLLNLCRSGATSEGVLTAQVPRVRPGVPGLVTIGVGVNDLSRQVPAAVFAQRLERIVSEVKARSPAIVVMSNLPDVSLAPVIPAAFRPAAAQLVQAYNAVIAATARRHDVTLVDMYTASRREIPAHPEFFSPDGFHPSDAGYRFWAGLMWPQVRGALPAQATPSAG